MSKITTRNPDFYQLPSLMCCRQTSILDPTNHQAGPPVWPLVKVSFLNPLLLFPALREKMTHLLLEGGGGPVLPVLSILLLASVLCVD